MSRFIDKRSILGVLFIVGSLLCGLTGLCVNSGQAIKVSRLSPVSASALAGGAVEVGGEVLVEGYIGEENEVVYPQGEFVAYLYKRRRISVNDDGQPKPERWRKWEQVTPPLLLDLADGKVQVENDDYAIENLRVVEGPEMRVAGSQSHIKYSITRYEGIAVGDPVIAVGTLMAGGEVPRIEAEFVARGTREEYIAGHRAGGIASCVGSAIVGVVGGFILLWDRIRSVWG